MDENMSTTGAVENEQHRTLFEIIVEFWMEGFNFIKYIFYDLLLGKRA